MSPHPDSKFPTRRDFIRQASCAAVGTWALKSAIRDLRLINAAVAQTGVRDDYKALVCVFLAGGNDSNNWIIPTDSTTFDAYTAIRQNLALPRNWGATATNPIGSLDAMALSGASGNYSDADGHTYAFHPSCTELKTLWDEQKLAAIMNVGTLVRPTTRANYTSSNSAYYKPPQLFSHSDQVIQWQTSIPDQPPTTGWGGRTADLLHELANSQVNNDPPRISMSVSLNGANVFQVGNDVAQYHVGTTGAITLSSVTGSRLNAVRDILNLSQPNTDNLQRAAFADVTKSAIETGELLNTNIQGTATASWLALFPNTTLGNQMKMIARLIAANGESAFNMHRQTFFCSVGGYDTHTNQVFVNNVGDDPTNVNGAHYKLLREVSQCMFAFQRAMEALNLADKVTAFTASDFSRTLPTNSQGSDHGWGSHQIVVGGAGGSTGAVAGRQTIGKLPTFALNGPDDTSLGRWIPTLAVDQYAATLAKWFGVDDNMRATIFPNLSRFATSNLGFMRPT
jgi:uncharacterized protein (DUF1501 family)